MDERKIMVGQRVRRLRQSQGSTQAEMASKLGISTSYLNLIERNQRPATVQFLLRLGQAFDIDLVQFAGNDEARIVAQLREVFADPIFKQSNISPQDIEDICSASPIGGEAIYLLYKLYRKLSDRHALGIKTIEENKELKGSSDFGLSGDSNPRELVLDYLQLHNNYFSDLEEASGELSHLFFSKGVDLLGILAEILESRHGVRSRVLPLDVMGETLCRYDRHGRRVLISEALGTDGRAFQMARQLVGMEWPDLLSDIVDKADLRDLPTKRYLKNSLTDYLARALLMPYSNFKEAANNLRHDFVLLSRRFMVPIDQICFRLTTLQQPGDKGVPIFLLQVDSAGNVLQRFSATKFYPPRFGGLCPRWNLYGFGAGAFSVWPSRIDTPNGLQFASFSIRTPNDVCGSSSRVNPTLVTIIGCESDHAQYFYDADDLQFVNKKIISEDGQSCGCLMCQLNS
tara:strand:+ start:5183 stop:6553 length:1371 start_codon:yes stop_codon:yes gene_type:complete